MNRQTYAGILALVLVFLAFGFLTGCSSSSSTPPPVIAITATGGGGQTANVGQAFANPLVANVTSNGTAASGLTVTFSAPATSGASCTLSSTTVTTDANGNASVTCTADSTTGTYNVTATTTGASSPAEFSLTNGSAYAFYVSGLEAPNTTNGGKLSYYALAGAVTIDPNGNVVGGQQDYNDGNGITSPSTGDLITGGTLTVDATGQGTLTLVTNNQYVGQSGTEIFAVQFANAGHALITQFDGSATSSGSMDLQTATKTSGNFAFILSGMDYNYLPVGYGGVFTAASGAITGTADVNDAGTMSQGPAGNMTGTDNGTAGSSYGRGTATVTINSTALSLVYYVVGPEVIRIIDMDAGGSSGFGSAAVGSAYGQGSGTLAFDSTALGASVFGLGQSNPFGYSYAAAGSFATTSTAGVASGAYAGTGDQDEEGAAQSEAISGSYTIGSNGYGSLTDTVGLGTIGSLGLYVTDPTLNLLDPNSPPATTTVSGALLLDLDTVTELSGGTGMVIPQTDLLTTDFENNTYVVGAHDYNTISTIPTGAPGNEFDFVGLAPFSTLVLTGAVGEVSDPFGFFATTGAEYTAVPFTGTATADPNEATNGRYTIFLNVTPSGTAGFTFEVAIYQANGGQLFWVDRDLHSLFLGTLEQQGSLTGVPALRKGKAVPKARAKKETFTGK